MVVVNEKCRESRKLKGHARYIFNSPSISNYSFRIYFFISLPERVHTLISLMIEELV